MEKIESLLLEEEEEALALYLLNKKSKKKNRRLWTHKIVQSRGETGLFSHLYKELRKDDEKFFDYLRMSIASFDELLGFIHYKIKKKDTIMRSSITPEERLVITLRYLATGCSFAELHSTFRVGKSTASEIIKDVTGAIWAMLSEKEIPPLKYDNFLKIAEGFQDSTYFPHCIGALDGKHIRLLQPENSGSLFYNYKKKFSIVLLAMCDANYKFTYIDIGFYGKLSDSGIFKNSTLYKELLEGSFEIPAESPLAGGQLFPYVIVADQGFAMSENLIRPYGGKSLSDEKNIFNYRLSQARQCIECTFRIMANKWRIFHRPLNVDIELAKKIVKATCVLHNFVCRRDGSRIDYVTDSEHSAFIDIKNDSTSRANPKVLAVRNQFAKFFVENPLEWQNEKI